MVRRTLGLIVWVAVFQAVIYAIHEFSNFHLTAWYQTLDKSPLHPPEVVFPLVWSTLYILITLAGWLLWQERNKKEGKTALKYFAVQIVLIWAWSPILFELHWVGVGFVSTLVIFAATFMTVVSCAEKFELAATLLSPTLLWLLYVAYLTGYIWLHN